MVLELLREHLDEPPIRLLAQAEGHRVRARTTDVRPGAEVAVEKTGRAIETEAPAVLESQLSQSPEPPETPAELPTAAAGLTSHDRSGGGWSALEDRTRVSNDPAIGDWVFLSDQPRPSGPNPRQLGVRVSWRIRSCSGSVVLRRLRSSRSSEVAVALVLAEVTAREAGLRLAGTIRMRVNDLLRNALSRP